MINLTNIINAEVTVSLSVTFSQKTAEPFLIKFDKEILWYMREDKRLVLLCRENVTKIVTEIFSHLLYKQGS